MRPQELFSLQNRVALVTGGGKGIGRSIAEALADADASVAITARSDPDAAKATVADLRSKGHTAMFVEGNVSKPSDVRSMVQAVEDALGPIRILVNNAGISERHAAREFPIDAWNSVLATNLSGPFLCSQSVFASMAAAGGGSIINVASIAGIVGVPGTVAYSASKGGLVSLTRALAIEWANDQVRVNAICPCPVETDLSRRVFADKPDVYRAMVAAIPLGRVAQPDDLQGVAVFLASDASSMVSGAIIPVDGGWSAQ